MAKITSTHLTQWRTWHLVNTDYGELQNIALGTAPHVITFLPNVGRFCESGAKSSNGAQRQHDIQIILLFNLQKENRLKVHKQSICGW